jgi:hypothetical protein
MQPLRQAFSEWLLLFEFARTKTGIECLFLCTKVRYLILDRMQNSSVLDSLVSYVLKPRENGCPLSQWVAERVAERKLLNEDGMIEMSNTCLELILAFVVCDV